jgi:hypothetical protein
MRIQNITTVQTEDEDTKHNNSTKDVQDIQHNNSTNRGSGYRA